MSLTRQDIETIQFRKAMRGYAVAEVDDFLIDVADAVGRLSEENERLLASLRQVSADLERYKEREATLRDTLLTTQKMTDDLKISAQREAKAIVDQAKAHAEGVVTRARTREAEIHEDIKALRRLRTSMELKLKHLLESHLALLATEAEEQDRFRFDEAAPEPASVSAAAPETPEGDLSPFARPGGFPAAGRFAVGAGKERESDEEPTFAIESEDAEHGDDAGGTAER